MIWIKRILFGTLFLVAATIFVVRAESPTTMQSVYFWIVKQSGGRDLQPLQDSGMIWNVSGPRGPLFTSISDDAVWSHDRQVVGVVGGDSANPIVAFATVSGERSFFVDAPGVSDTSFSEAISLFQDRFSKSGDLALLNDVLLLAAHHGATHVAIAYSNSADDTAVSISGSDLCSVQRAMGAVGDSGSVVSLAR